MFVVILVYSTISPLILVFGVIYFAMSYLVCKYQLLYGKNKRRKSDGLVLMLV